jgi:hypothetical protein
VLLKKDAHRAAKRAIEHALRGALGRRPRAWCRDAPRARRRWNFTTRRRHQITADPSSACVRPRSTTSAGYSR